MTLTIEAVNDWIDTHSEMPVRILVVDDSPDDQELLRRQLHKARLDQSVLFIDNGRDAFDLVCGAGSSLVREELIALFLDVHLPGMNGIELLRHIRSLPGMEHFPVIIMTDSRNPQDYEECQQLKVAGFIEKPVTVHTFSKSVANVFHQGANAGNAIERFAGVRANSSG